MRGPLEPALGSLPDACLAQVLGHLPATDLLTAARANKRFRQLTADPAIWRNLFSRDFEHHYGPAAAAAQPKQWAAAYRARHGVQRRWRQGKPTASKELKSHNGPVFAVACLSDPFPAGKLAVTGGVFGFGEVSELFLWNSQQQAMPLEWPTSILTGGVFQLGQLPGRPQLVTCGYSGPCQLVALEPTTLEALSLQKLQDLATDLPYVATATRQELEDHVGRFGELLAARHTHTLEGHQGAVPGHSAKRDLVATAGFDGTCRVWRPEVLREGDDEVKAPVCQSCVGLYTEPPQLEGEIDQQSVAVCSVELSADCTSMAVGCNDTQVKVWDLETRKITSRLRGQDGWIWCLEQFGDCGNLLCTGATDGAVRLWDVRTGGQVHSVQVTRIGDDSDLSLQQGPIAGLGIRPDRGMVVAGAFDKNLHLIDARSWRVMSELEGHKDRVTRLHAADDCIISVSFDATVRHWNFADL